jgi:hypothetical protein
VTVRNTFFYCDRVDLSDKKKLKATKQKFDEAEFLVCYCASCAQYFALRNRYEQYVSMTARVARKSKYAIADFQARQKMFANHAVYQSKEGIIDAINSNGSVLMSMCPKCMLDDYKILFELMEDKKTDVIKLSDKYIFEKNSLSDIAEIIETVYQKQLFSGYINVKDLREQPHTKA